MAFAAVVMLCCLVSADAEVVRVTDDNVEITESCRAEIAADPIIDADDDGVIHIVGDDIFVEFGLAPLDGAPDGRPPHAYRGTGIVITGRNVTLRGAAVHGFKVGIKAVGASGLVLQECDVSDNLRQRLRSTAQRERSIDWLQPHQNDEHAWVRRYGAGVSIVGAENVTIRNVRARQVQNGIVLNRVTDSRVYDNDCSFLSGWGLAMWRSSGNVISRNAFDFCVRGYSHGVYNRGQDSAGILMFEQCSENVIAENSATHCGDGVFGFAGREALGEANPRDDLAWYEQRGNNRNLLIGNDFSYAAAHGIEMTFSFGNRFYNNKLIGNAICGVWGGYSQNTHIAGNSFAGNGEMGYGAERGGVNIEHGSGNRIEFNRFRNNACGVHLWWDDDEALLKTPWARANEKGSTDNIIRGNRFSGDTVAIQLRKTTGTQLAENSERRVETFLDADEASSVLELGATEGSFSPPPYPVFGNTQPVGARKHLRGRKRIIMTEWGPYDWEGPAMILVEREAGTHAYRLLGGAEEVERGGIEVSDSVRAVLAEDLLTLQPFDSNTLVPYEVSIDTGGRMLRRQGVLARLRWELRVFPYQTDPRKDVDAWREEARRKGITFYKTKLNFDYGMDGPSQVIFDSEVIGSQLPKDHFGMMAESVFELPEGKWRINTTSDDGIRVWLDDELIIDDWTHHAPREHSHEIIVDEAREATLRLEHFELDGYAVLSVSFEETR